MSRFLRKCYARSREWWYRGLSDSVVQAGTFKARQAVLLLGLGKVAFGNQVTFGFFSSPHFFSSYTYIEVRLPTSSVVFGNEVKVNNGCSFISDGAGISIGDRTLIGTRVEVYDSDFHRIDPRSRLERPEPASVRIGDNVFIGSNSVILKGVSIGDNSVIGCGSVVTQSIPPNSVAAGNPARVIRTLVSTTDS